MHIQKRAVNNNKKIVLIIVLVVLSVFAINLVSISSDYSGYAIKDIFSKNIFGKIKTPEPEPTTGPTDPTEPARPATPRTFTSSLKSAILGLASNISFGGDERSDEEIYEDAYQSCLENGYITFEGDIATYVSPPENCNFEISIKRMPSECLEYMSQCKQYAEDMVAAAYANVCNEIVRTGLEEGWTVSYIYDVLDATGCI